MKVDDYLLSLQQHKDDAMSLIPAGEPLSIKQEKRAIATPWLS